MMRFPLIFSDKEVINFHVGIFLLRCIVGGLMLTHGWPKLNILLSSNEIKFVDPIGVGPEISLIMVVFSEFFCSIFLILGLWVRLATIPQIITMTVAAFIAHGDDPFKMKEMAIIYGLLYVVILIMGAGKYSLSHFWKDNRVVTK